MLEQMTPFARPSLRRVGDYSSFPGMVLQPAFSNQMLDRFVCGAGMDVQIGGKGANRRKWLADLIFAADERFLGGEDQLIENWLARAYGEPKCHAGSLTHKTP